MLIGQSGEGDCFCVSGIALVLFNGGNVNFWFKKFWGHKTAITVFFYVRNSRKKAFRHMTERWDFSTLFRRPL